MLSSREEQCGAKIRRATLTSTRSTNKLDREFYHNLAVCALNDGGYFGKFNCAIPVGWALE